VCENSSASFSVSTTGTALTYQWRKGTVNLIDGGNIFGATNDTLTINPVNTADASANYNVIVTGVCPPNDTSLTAALIVIPAPTAIAGSNSPVCTDSTISLTAQTVVNSTYDWTGPNTFSSSDQNPVILSATSAYAGTYMLTVTANGCVSSPSTVSIIVNDCIDFHIPDGFSPNGDGVNDLFVIRGIDAYPLNTFTIYNRWGDKVFHASPYTNTWDGKSQFGITIGGNDLPIGTYFYVLDLGDGTPVYEGTIYLNK
jgi:gliding motility-associated-like protein